MSPATPDEAGDVTVVLSDAEVVDTSGKAMRFRSDVVGDKTVAINFVYTSCTTICPPLAGIFEGGQAKLGDRLGRDVRMITVSIDPTVDTPERMRAMATKFHARPAGCGSPGAKDAIDGIVKGLEPIRRTSKVIRRSCWWALAVRTRGRGLRLLRSGRIANRTLAVADGVAAHGSHARKEKR